MAVRKGTFNNLVNDIKAESQSPSSKRIMKLDDIKDRPHGDTRLLNPEHVDELVESIAAVGLIQPLAVDSAGHLLAGGHRRAALTELEISDPERFEALFSLGVPVRVFAFNADDDPDKAIAIEAAENEKRRDYTPSEVRELADRLINAGYKDTSGRPKKGDKALTPALMTILGKSKRTVRRYLSKGDTEKMVPLGTISKKEKIAQRLEKIAADPEAEAIARSLRNAAKRLRELDDEEE